MSGRPELRFGTKAETLARLEALVSKAVVLPQVRFTVEAWRRDASAVIDGLRERGWFEHPVIVRSSAQSEDGTDASLAGRYLSLGGVEGEAELARAVERVAAELPDPAGRDQVFVQPELRDVRSSGVVLTRDPANGSRYRIVNHESGSGLTDRITSGRAENRRTYFRHRDASGPPPAEFAQVLELAVELERLFDHDALDFEYAVARDGVLHLLQVRRLVLADAAALGPSEERHALEQVRDRIAELSRPHPYLFRTRAIFGTMPDWNPAEVIGARPKPLALSLYRELVTDGIWAYQRHNYGYRNLRSFPLVVSLGGLPYVDVRVSFHSFVPADLDDDLGERLVAEYTRRLLASPPDHDKVEFSVLHSCYALDLPERLAALEQHGFSAEECATIGASLRALTNRITSGGDSLFRADLERIAELERRQRAYARGLGELDEVSRTYWLLEDCKRYGTLPFAGIARAAFIAVQLLDSLVATGLLEAKERGRFLRSLATVGVRMGRDLSKLPREGFLARYGHLRPGTYDIESPRYDEAPETYFDWQAPAKDALPQAFELPAASLGRIDRALREHGLAHDARGLFAFLRDAIEGRERAKFVFTRNLSDALRTLSQLGERLGLSRADLSFADIDCIRRLYASSDDPREVLETSIRAGRRRFAVTRALTLPPLVTAPDDAFAFALPDSAPNYITQGSAAGPVVTPEAARATLRGGIVLIPSADPGYDWIFSCAPAGFVTMYGGYNSHMAIRANELGLPAVIGAGSTLFESWSRASRLRLDCLNRRVEVTP